LVDGVLLSSTACGVRGTERESERERRREGGREGERERGEK